MTEILNNVFFIFQRISWLSVLDIMLVTLIFFGLLYSLRDTQAMALLRGMILLVVALILLTSLVDLPAFSWFAQNSLPALLLALPVIFAPEIRRTLERLGRAGTIWPASVKSTDVALEQTIRAVVSAAARLSARQHGALIIMQRLDTLDELAQSGVQMYARVTPELLLQIFYPNTPLHDGGVIIVGSQIVAAACVLPLSASGILNRTPERQMGLRHRAALGTSETSDAIAVVVSEETGAISIAHAGRMLRRLDPDRLENILTAFFRPNGKDHKPNLLERLFPGLIPTKKDKP
ncbi:MAG TPA: diadenylate cyclase CdaA [Anaerolineales bacterium]|nr:diadenylate cyclase CdaA [Anaerolineales bacterium]HMV97683.1 diadenylate cyclase CdaA [Anaerolineales bacterium]HMX20151.1 diadenylate cyclase CdaA [Anaerolineales bacterium]HMX72668.1 diadenylate cyclase CdaA [Anaerolineales bacterium]HMZ41658.1 diadenylate cyclase CdaA [Anaerolineales bacterium]